MELRLGATRGSAGVKAKEAVAMATPRAGSVVNKPAGFKPDDGGFTVGWAVFLPPAPDAHAGVSGSNLRPPV